MNTNQEKLEIVWEYRNGTAWPDECPPWIIIDVEIQGKDAPTFAELEAFTPAQIEEMQGDIDVRKYGPKIAALVSLLSAFGLAMPIERADAVTAINLAVRSDATKIPDALLLLSVLAELPLSDRRIYVAAGRLP